MDTSQPYFDPTSVQRIGLSQPVQGFLVDFFNLTPSEIAVLEMLVMGFTVQRAAKRQSKSPETIRTHLKNLSSKMYASSQNEILATVRLIEIQSLTSVAGTSTEPKQAPKMETIGV